MWSHKFMFEILGAKINVYQTVNTVIIFHCIRDDHNQFLNSYIYI
jgi:hypothetical protein